MSSTLCIVAARGGSKGVPNKNIRPISGTTLTGLAVEQGMRLFDRVLVSTDDDQIASVARRHGGDVPFVRPAHLATDAVGKIPVLRHAVDWWESNKREEIDLVVDLSCTTPLRADEDISGALSLFEDSPNADNVITICEARENPFFNQVLMAADRSLRLVLDGSGETPLSRQSAPSVYAINGAVYVWSRHALDEGETVVRDGSVGYVMPADRSLDIDSESEFRLAELLIGER